MDDTPDECTDGSGHHEVNPIDDGLAHACHESDVVGSFVSYDLHFLRASEEVAYLRDDIDEGDKDTEDSDSTFGVNLKEFDESDADEDKCDEYCSDHEYIVPCEEQIREPRDIKEVTCDFQCTCRTSYVEHYGYDNAQEQENPEGYLRD